VNASDHNNIHVEWVSNISSGGVPLSPTVVENRTIIVPTLNGPLYAFDAKTGRELAALSFWDNSSNETISRVRNMNWSDFLSILSHPEHCPFHYNSTVDVVEWNSTVRYEIMPVPYVFF
jgi:outer membrane protein assembly factor BamB